jgi:hypothetical protein
MSQNIQNSPSVAAPSKPKTTGWKNLVLICFTADFLLDIALSTDLSSEGRFSTMSESITLLTDGASFGSGDGSKGAFGFVQGRYLATHPSQARAVTFPM